MGYSRDFCLLNTVSASAFSEKDDDELTELLINKPCGVINITGHLLICKKCK